MSKTASRFALRTKILGLTLGIVAVLCASGAILMNQVTDGSKTSILESYSTYANSLQTAIAAQFYERYGDVQAFALNPGLQKDRAEIVKYLNDYVALYGIYDLIMLVDARGKLMAVNSKGPDGKMLNVDSLYNKNYADAAWYKGHVDGPL